MNTETNRELNEKEMIAKTQEEKQLLKLAKQKYSQSVKEDKELREKIKQHLSSQPKYTFDKFGILESETLLPDDYPIYADYLYVIDDDGGKVIRSDIFKGTILHLKRDLRKLGYKAINIYSCDIFKRRKEII